LLTFNYALFVTLNFSCCRYHHWTRSRWKGGFYKASASFLKKLCPVADEQRECLLILWWNSIGVLRRTGTIVCTNKLALSRPMTTAKGIAGGIPLAAVVGKADIMGTLNPQAPRWGRYGGFSCRLCGRPCGIWRDRRRETMRTARHQIGARLSISNRTDKADYPTHYWWLYVTRRRWSRWKFVHEVCGINLTELAKKLSGKALFWKRPSVIGLCVFAGNVIRFLPALTIEIGTIHREALSIFKRCFKRLFKSFREPIKTVPC